MHPSKKMKADMDADPFSDDDDWDDDDDLMQLVADEVPTSSQMSQAIKAPPIKRSMCDSANGNLHPKAGLALSGTHNGKFMFKRPSNASSLLSTKPVSYTSMSKLESPCFVASPSLTSSKTGHNSEVEVKSHSKRPLNDIPTQQLPLNGDNLVDMSTLRKQVSDLIRKQHAHEGEIKWLRATLKDKEGQINTVRATVNAEAAKQRLHNSEIERGYVKDIESLRSELQFKESELINVTQALEKLKREKLKPAQPVLKLGSDGFPASTEGFNGTMPACRVVVTSKSLHTKVEPMETDIMPTAPGIVETVEPNCDLKPLACNRLVPRKLSISEFKRKATMSAMLKSNMENIKHNVDRVNIGGQGQLNNPSSGVNREQCLNLLSESIECAKSMCYM